MHFYAAEHLKVFYYLSSRLIGAPVRAGTSDRISRYGINLGLAEPTVASAAAAPRRNALATGPSARKACSPACAAGRPGTGGRAGRP
jgi:hypothetical protein